MSTMDSLLRGVSFDATEEAVRDIFDKMGPISQIFLVRNPNGKVEGYGLRSLACAHS